MSSAELKAKILSIVERNSNDEVWLSRIYEILESGELHPSNDWWKELSQDQQTRLDQSIAMSERGEVISNDEAMDLFQ